jgi:hypothetical protein
MEAMLRNSLLIGAAAASIIVGAVSVQAQPSQPDQVAPKDHMMMQNMQMMMQDMHNMHAQMSKMAENCNKMMEGMMPRSAPSEQKK